MLIVFKNLVKLCRAKDIFTKFQEVARKYIQLGPSLTSWSIGNKKGIYRPKQTRVYISQDVIDGLQYTVHSNLPLDVTLQGFQRLVLATVINADTGSFSLKTRRNLLILVILKYISKKQMLIMGYHIRFWFCHQCKNSIQFYYNFNEYDIFCINLRNHLCTTNFQNCLEVSRDMLL